MQAARFVCALAVALLAACASDGSRQGPPTDPAAIRARVRALLPASLGDRDGWAADFQSAYTALGLPSDAAHLCAAIAVTEQESSFQTDPRVPNLPRLAQDELFRRAERFHVPAIALRAALQIESPGGRTYAQRLDAVRTERDLSDIYEDFVSMVPLGRRLLADYNPVRTGGPMQVSIAFAQAHTRRRSYPYSNPGSIRDAVFSRRGGLYFGVAHLLDYPAHYDAMLFRFADYNAGHYASRNAAFQQALRVASGRRIALDGDLVRHGLVGDAPGETEAAARSLAGPLGIDGAAIHRALEQGDSIGFEDTLLYRRVFALAERRGGRGLPRAVLPEIVLHGPKISRRLSTAWFARRVDGRYRNCLGRATGSAAS